MTMLDNLTRQTRQNPSDLLRTVLAIAEGQPVPREAVLGVLAQSRALIGMLNDYSCEETTLREAAGSPAGGINHRHMQGTLTTAADLVSLALVALDSD